MAEKVDLSLDDIIKMNKKGPRKPRQGNNNNNKPNKSNSQRLRNLGARSGLIRKGGPKSTVPQSKQQQSSIKSRESTMLHVSNLHYNVSNDDIKELFSEIGPIKKAAVHYDKSGRSLGTAEVIFATRDAAIRAIKKYNKVPLDSRPMTITLVPSQTTVPSPTKSRIGVKPGSGIYKRQQHKSPRRNGQNPKGRPDVNRGQKPRPKREPKKEVTAEQLDADLEAYTMNNDKMII